MLGNPGAKKDDKRSPIAEHLCKTTALILWYCFIATDGETLAPLIRVTLRLLKIGDATESKKSHEHLHKNARLCMACSMR